jgi:hypothetical protein
VAWPNAKVIFRTLQPGFLAITRESAQIRADDAAPAFVSFDGSDIFKPQPPSDVLTSRLIGHRAM